MNDVVVDEIVYIDEKSYQQIKKKMGKSDDYFTLKELMMILRGFNTI